MKSAAAKREYRQTARADAAQATADRILDAFTARMEESWFEEIRLEDVAHDAGVSVPTVVRRFGGKEGLLDAAHQRMGEEIQGMRQVAPGDVEAAVRVLSEDYEANGDLVMRSLAQEDRYPAMKRMTDLGRRYHRNWVAQVFAPRLETLDRAAAEARLDTLVVATDVYVWKLIRRDMRRPPPAYRQAIARLIAAALADDGAHR
jgi:AcrR family transcriptional regulator